MIDKKNEGKRVELIFTDDPWTKLVPGSKGTYRFANIQPGITQHMIRWDDGSSLSLIEGVDQFKFIE